jgi:hypothetical protein
MMTDMKYVSINGQTIRHNAITGERKAPIRIARSRSDAKPKYAHEIRIEGRARLVYQPSKPIMRCGARLVLIADDVTVIR